MKPLQACMAFFSLRHKQECDIVTQYSHIAYHKHLPVMISCVLIVGSAATFSRMSWMTLEGILDVPCSGWL